MLYKNDQPSPLTSTIFKPHLTRGAVFILCEWYNRLKQTRIYHDVNKLRFGEKMSKENRGKIRTVMITIAVLVITVVVAVYFTVFLLAKQQKVHVAVSGSDEEGTGTQDAPYATVSAASEAAPGAIIVVHEGEYGPIRLGPECSGSENAPTVIRPAEGEKVMIRGGDGIGISLVNVSHVAVEGLEVDGGTHGIYYESTRKSGGPLTYI